MVTVVEAPSENLRKSVVPAPKWALIVGGGAKTGTKEGEEGPKCNSEDSERSKERDQGTTRKERERPGQDQDKTRTD